MSGVFDSLLAGMVLPARENTALGDKSLQQSFELGSGKPGQTFVVCLYEAYAFLSGRLLVGQCVGAHPASSSCWCFPGACASGIRSRKRPRDHINIRILQTMVFGIPLILRLGTSI